MACETVAADGRVGLTRTAAVGGFALEWAQGEAHARPVSTAAAGHLFAIRLGCGAGSEALESDRLAAASWPAFSVEYRPPGARYNHTTELASDWLSLTLGDRDLEHLVDAADGRAGFRPGRYGVVGDPAVRRAVRCVRSLLLGADPPDGAVLAGSVDALLAVWLGADAIAPANDPHPLPAARLRRVQDLVEASLSTGISLDEMAAAAGHSRFHFAKAFRATTGQTPHRYVVERRLAHACRALTATDVPLSEIALDAGFADQSHLTRHFRQRLGCTPARYRHHLREERKG